MENERDYKINKRRKIILIIVFLMLLIASIYIGIKMVTYENENGDVVPPVVATPDVVPSTSEGTEKVVTERMKQVAELQKKNSDVVGYLEIPGTNVSYPVVQAKDNNYYMRRTYEKKSSKYGALFVDKDYSFSKPSSNMMIYGHNIGDKKNKMFEQLLEYQKESFYKEHPNIIFTTATEESTYEIIAAFRSRVYTNLDKNVFRYYFFIDAKNEQEFNDYVKNSIAAGTYKTGKTAKYGDELMTLSTCTYYEEDGRFAVVARKVK